MAVLARKPDGEPAGGVDGRDDLFVDRARQHHFDDVDGFLVGDPEPVDEFAFDLQPFQHVGDLRPAAVDDDRVDADLAQQHDVAGEHVRQLGITHGVAAVFDHQRLAGVTPHVRHRLGQNRRLAQPIVR